MNRVALSCLALGIMLLPASLPADTVTQNVTTQQTAPADLPRIRLEPMFKLQRPTYAVHDPAGRMFFLEQPGRIRLYENGALVETPYLDISKKVVLDYECGLLSIAFHPKFAENGYFYANFTVISPVLKTVIAEYHVDPAAKVVDPSTERVVMTINQPFINHKGGQLQFGPDGYLYIGMGDGGGQHDSLKNGQNPQVLLGKMLRIDVTPRQGYAIPKDNPYVSKSNPAWAPEIYAIGLRNPWRFSFDAPTGLLYVGDVGQDTWEEVDIVQKGGNYGWSSREGTVEHDPMKPISRTIDPIFQYNHDKTAASITGGYVYHGKKIPALAGWYVFGEYSQGRIYGLKYEGGKVTVSGMIVNPKDPERKGGLKNPSQPSSFGEDIDGELYMIDNNGPVYRIVAEK
ncbi:MAG TPA: PQQ-dependent sugar dehydrogenase [Tepidisphaeraceae bacterium]|jgi:glucose/arabinose dehydrogenase